MGRVLDSRLRRGIDLVTLVSGAAFFSLAVWLWHMDPIAVLMMSFFGFALLRKTALDRLLRGLPQIRPS